MAPHVPGEFPTEDGLDPHMPGAFPVTPAEEVDQGIGSDSTTAAGSTTAGVGSASAVGGGVLGAEAERTGQYPTETTTAPEPTKAEQDTDHHYGRDAAIAGVGTAAVGAAGYGTYQAVNYGDSKATEIQDTTKSEPSKLEKVKEKVKEKTGTKSTEQSGTQPSEQTVTSTADEEQPEESHYGRDAAIVGGTGAAAGAVGYGVYSATQDDPNDTGPASKTIGPHSSNVANVLDPRVKPEPEKMKESEPITTGPHKSDLANIADPRIQSEPSRYEQTEPVSQYRQEEYARESTPVRGTDSYEAERSQEFTPESSRKSHESPDNRIGVDSRGHRHLHKKSVEQPGEKRPGVVSRMFHPNRTKREKEEREAARQSMEGRSSYENGQQSYSPASAQDTAQSDAYDYSTTPSKSAAPVSSGDQA
jgi:hypothetical protein